MIDDSCFNLYVIFLNHEGSKATKKHEVNTNILYSRELLKKNVTIELT